jgi:hypothetical protein
MIMQHLISSHYSYGDKLRHSDNSSTTKPANAIKEDNKCCAKGCTKFGRLLLKINYINKTGYFCNSCAQDLQQGLAVETEGVNA